MIDMLTHQKRLAATAGLPRSGCCALLALVAGSLLTSTTWAASTGPIVQISDLSPFGALESCGNFPGVLNGTNFVNSEVEPWVDVNPTDSDNIVAIWQQDRWSDGGSRGNVAGVSTNGGVDWQIVPIPDVTDCTGGPWERASDPWLSFAPDGTLYHMSLVFQVDPPANRPNGFGPNAMVVSRSTDGGETWDDPITLIEDDDPLILNDKNSLTADPTNSDFAYAVWDRLQITGADAIFPVAPENLRPGIGIGLGFRGPVYFARTTDGGDTWEKARKIYGPGGTNQTIANQIVVQPDGTVIDFFTEILNFRNDDGGSQFDARLSLIRSTDHGATWQRKAIRTNEIISFGVVTPDELIPVRDASILFDVAVDPISGALHAVWQDVRFNRIEEVAFSQSTDGGFTWSAPVKINLTPPTPGNPLRAQAFLPSIAVRADGTLMVTYYDFRNDDDTAGVELADYFAIFCSAGCDQAGNWGHEVRLTDTSFDYALAPFARGLFLGDYMGLAADGGIGDFLPVFAIANVFEEASIFLRRTTP